MGKVIGKAKGKLEIKRLHVPGVKIQGTCPTCGNKVEDSLEANYFQYPELGKPQEFNFICEKEVSGPSQGEKGFDGKYYCSTEWTEEFSLDLIVSSK